MNKVDAAAILDGLRRGLAENPAYMAQLLQDESRALDNVRAAIELAQKALCICDAPGCEKPSHYIVGGASFCSEHAMAPLRASSGIPS